MATGSASNDGVANPAGAGVAAIFPPVFIAAVPLATYLAQPDSIVEKIVSGVVRTTVYIGSAGSTSQVPNGRVIPALSALYIFLTYGLGGATSAAALDMSSLKGRDNNHPRAQVASLSGLPLRMYSAHAHLMETFGGYALAASMAAAIAPNNQHVINLLGLHILSKVFLFWPSYLANIGPSRTLGHVLSVGSLIGVAWKLARGAT